MRLRSHSKRLSRDVLLYERKALSVREKEPTKWRHGSPAESGLSRACRPWPTGGRQTTKRAVSAKVSADGPRLLALAVPVNQRTVPGGPRGAFYGRRAHGRARGRANGIPGGGRGLSKLMKGSPVKNLKKSPRNQAMAESSKLAALSSAAFRGQKTDCASSWRLPQPPRAMVGHIP